MIFFYKLLLIVMYINDLFRVGSVWSYARLLLAVGEWSYERMSQSIWGRQKVVAGSGDQMNTKCNRPSGMELC